MQSDKDKSKNAHFGFREIPHSAKSGLVSEVFNSVAERYDLMNDLMSFGLHRMWKHFAVRQSGVREGQQVIDVAGGTGDLASLFAQRTGPRGRVVIADVNDAMLKVGRSRLADRGIVGNVQFVQADAERLPFRDNHFDCVSVAFGLRNMTHMDRALESMFRVLKPGGRILILEFSRPTRSGLARVYDAYSFAVIPRLGRLVANDEASYRYLVESIRRHPDQQALKALMEAAGFVRVNYFNLSGGIVALHRAYKV